ncbi:MAG: SRPBCC domain-containing protein [Acidobacteriota bacterium]
MSEAGVATRTVVVEKELAHAPEKVWRALTEGELIARWLMANDFKPVVGHRFQLRTQPVGGWSGVIDCEVLEVVASQRLSYTWNTMGVDTVATFTLTPTAEGTALRIEQSGFSEAQEQNYKGAMYGWRSFVGKLESVVNEMNEGETR